jgi:cytochrome c6
MQIVMQFVFVLGVCLLAVRPALAADPQQGRQIYELHCEACHGVEGDSIDPGTPRFAGGDSLFLMDQDLLRQIREGKNTMPAYRGLLSDEEIRDVIAYLRTL